MSLLSRLREKQSVRFATATPATVATLGGDKWRTVATVATVAVATATEAKTATASRWWLLHYPDREPVEVASFPPATHAEILERHPEAIAAEPIKPATPEPGMPAKDTTIAPDLERLIVRAGAYWEYSPDDYDLIWQAALRDPDGLRLALENDVAFRKDAP